MAVLIARFTMRRTMLGLALIIIGIVILIGSLWAIEELPLSFVIAFVSIVMIMLGGTIMTSFPIKALLKALLLTGVWWFLMMLPIFYVPLPPEIPPLAGSLSLLLLVFLVGLYERHSKRKPGKIEK